MTEFNAKLPSKRYQNTLALTFMPKESEAIQQTIESELALMKQDGPVGRNPILLRELTKISEIVRNKQFRADSQINQVLEAFCEANLSEENLESIGNFLPKLELQMLAASNPQARESIPAAFKKPLGLIKS